MLSPRHGDMPTDGPGVQHHWGYFSRQLPCTSDPGNCAYLDAVYGNHDLSMIYSAILWAVIGGILVLAALAHYSIPISRRITTDTKTQTVEEQPSERQNALYRGCRAVHAILNRHLLPESFVSLFGHTTRLNLLVLVVLIGYLTIFTFVGITYKTWTSPIEGSELRTTRVGLGPWADRIGVMAYALTPLSLLLSSRESVLSLITGIPYHHFNFLHRWLGYIIYLQSALHTIGWTVVEGRLYQPQPQKWNSFISQQYIIAGIVAMIAITFLVLHSTKWAISITGYEFFRKAHYVVALLFVGTCWGHWVQLRCWMIASLILWMLDRTIRLMRVLFIHCASHPYKSYALCNFYVPKATVASYPNSEDGDVVRLDFRHDYPPWKIGQHFYLCFPDLSIWQSHPMTPSSVPIPSPHDQGQIQSHTYIIRAKKGLTKDLAQVARQPQAQPESSEKTSTNSTSVVLSGPYGQSIVDGDLIRTNDINILCVAGGTGVTFILPVLMALALSNRFSCRSGQTEFIWVIRRKTDMQWISKELDILRAAAKLSSNLRIRIFVTREDFPVEGDSSPSSQITEAGPTDKEFSQKIVEKSCCAQSAPSEEAGSESFTVQHTKTSNMAHPDLAAIVAGFVSGTAAGPTRVMASGPSGMISDLRKAVASSNDPGQVWKGNERYDVQLVYDDRLEW